MVQLFRAEALRGQDRLHGEVVLVPPVSWQIVGLFLLLTIVVAGLFLATAEYSKVATVQGRIAAGDGLARALAPRAGRVEAVLVSEGQRVEAGTPLLRLAVSASDEAGSLGERRAAAVARQAEMLGRRAPAMAETLAARMRGLAAQIEGDRNERASLAAQIAEQRALIRSAAEELERARAVAARGFVSARDVREREELLATRRQGLSRLEQEASARAARIAVAEAELARTRAEHGLEAADLARAQAELTGVAAADENTATIVVTAARAGIVTGIAVDEGDALAPGSHVMTIVPEAGRLEARLEVPTAAAGFIEPGQTMRLAVDAFPSQIYGTVDARVDSVSLASVPVERADGSADEAFLIRATLAADAVRAYGRDHPLRPGMAVSARITTRKRSLVEWLFDPLFAVGRR